MAITTTRTAIVLEHASQEFVYATSVPPFIYELTPGEARNVVDDVQAEPIEIRYDGITHDFMMLSPLSGTQATRPAIAQAISILRKALHDA